MMKSHKHHRKNRRPVQDPLLPQKSRPAPRQRRHCEHWHLSSPKKTIVSREVVNRRVNQTLT